MILLLASMGVARAEAQRPLQLPEFRHIAPLASVREAAGAAGIKLEGRAPLTGISGVGLGDEVTLLVSRAEGGKLQQWVINLQATDVTAAEQARPFTTATVYTSSGHHFTFSGGRAALTLRMIGPLRAADEGREKAMRPKVEERRILVSADYLSLGLDRVPAMALRMRALREQDPSLPPVNLKFSDHPFPAEVVAETLRQQGMSHITAEDEKAFNGAILALQEFLLTINRTPGLREVLMSVVDVPWWPIIRSGGQVNLNFVSLNTAARALPTERDGLSATGTVYSWPFRLQINGKDALMFQLAVVAPQSPLAVAAGIVGIVAGQPDGKGPVLHLDLIASRVAPRKKDLAASE